jgi:hypothetical protein
MERLSKEELLAENLKAKADYRLVLAQLPIEKKLEMVREMIAIARQAGTLPEWYYRLMEKK